MEVVKVKTIPTIPTLTIPAPIEPPVVKPPQVIVITATDAAFYAQACVDFTDAEARLEDAYTLEEVNAMYPGLTRGSACDWAIYGLTVQGWLTLESQLNDIGLYAQQLRDRIAFLEGLIKDLQEAAKLQEEAILSND